MLIISKKQNKKIRQLFKIIIGKADISLWNSPKDVLPKDSGLLKQKTSRGVSHK